MTLAVLLVEDHDRLRDTVCEYLVTLGIRAVGADSVPKALRLLDAESFDVIVTDLYLGERLAIPLLYAGPPAILTTAFSVARTAEYPCHTILVKPYDLGTLRKSIIHAAQEARATRSTS